MANAIAFLILADQQPLMQTFKTSKTKEKILSKIRMGLSKGALPMPFPEVDKEQVGSVFTQPGTPVEETFAEAFIKLGGKFVYCDDEQEFLDNIHSLYDSQGWRQIFCAQQDMMSLFQNNNLSFVSAADPSNETADACITGCEALVARTGSILLSSKQNLGRIASVFYPVHIVVAYPGQIVEDIQQSVDFLKKKYAGSIPSMINLNTGPSRTADIEKTLVVGVHGPKEVFCFFINR
jgi:L-lactate dehydrogenase complex protein LldG